MNHQYQPDAQGRPHWDKDYDPSPEQRAAVRGTARQRRQWRLEEESLINEVAGIESDGRLGNAGLNILENKPN